MQVGILRGGCEVEIWKSSQEVETLGEDCDEKRVPVSEL